MRYDTPAWGRQQLHHEWRRGGGLWVVGGHGRSGVCGGAAGGGRCVDGCGGRCGRWLLFLMLGALAELRESQRQGLQNHSGA